MSVYNIPRGSMQKYIDSLLEQLRSKVYSEGSITNYRLMLKSLCRFMETHCVDTYSSAVGRAFVASDDRIVTCSKAFPGTVIRRFEDHIQGKWQLKRTKGPVLLSEQHEHILAEYLAKAVSDGNSGSTVGKKRKLCGKFLNYLEQMSCRDICCTKTELIFKVYAQFGRSDRYAIKHFLKYLYENGNMRIGIHAFLPHSHQPQPLPTAYSEEEIRELEDAVETSTELGIRDYSIILLATRYGLRACDIAKLRFNEINFETYHIKLIQQKTGVVWERELLPEAGDALQNYISHARPASDSDYVFLSTLAPCRRMTAEGVSSCVRRYLRKADIDTTGKKSGAHAMRSSLTSSMINDGYDPVIVREILGHKDPEAIRHYARINIGKLRECAIPVPEPQGLFASFLGWEAKK